MPDGSERGQGEGADEQRGELCVGGTVLKTKVNAEDEHLGDEDDRCGHRTAADQHGLGGEDQRQPSNA